MIALQQTKEEIDNMTYSQLLRRWRFAKIGDEIFSSEVGLYYSSVMAKKKEIIGPEAAVATSKEVGW